MGKRRCSPIKNYNKLTIGGIQFKSNKKLFCQVHRDGKFVMLRTVADLNRSKWGKQLLHSQLQQVKAQVAIWAAKTSEVSELSDENNYIPDAVHGVKGLGVNVDLAFDTSWKHSSEGTALLCKYPNKVLDFYKRSARAIEGEMKSHCILHSALQMANIDMDEESSSKSLEKLSDKTKLFNGGLYPYPRLELKRLDTTKLFKGGLYPYPRLELKRLDTTKLFKGGLYPRLELKQLDESARTSSSTLNEVDLASLLIKSRAVEEPSTQLKSVTIGPSLKCGETEDFNFSHTNTIRVPQESFTNLNSAVVEPSLKCGETEDFNFSYTNTIRVPQESFTNLNSAVVEPSLKCGETGEINFSRINFFEELGYSTSNSYANLMQLDLQPIAGSSSSFTNSTQPMYVEEPAEILAFIGEHTPRDKLLSRKFETILHDMEKTDELV